MALSRRQFLGTGAIVVGGGVVAAAAGGGTASAAPAPVNPGSAPGQSVVTGQEISTGWTFAADSAALTGRVLSSAGTVAGLAPAVVPGTPLVSMIANGLYPDPLYRHIVTETVPDTLKDHNYWYRASFDVPKLIDGQRFWLQLDGVNYLADIWLNGTQVGSMEGAFIRGTFDVTDVVARARGGKANLAVLVRKLDYVDPPSLPSYASGVTRGRRNGGPTGITLANGPTFFCTAGWDWIPTIPDRDLGIWQPVRWSTTGPIRLSDVHVDPTLSQNLNTADVTLELTFDSASRTEEAVTITGSIGDTTFKHPMIVPAGTSSVTLTSADISQLRMSKPQLWWPNGYGDPYLYNLTVRVVRNGGMISDENTQKFGVRRIEFSMPRTDPSGAAVDTLAITVNNQPILTMGGNWGMDEALKRIPRTRLFEQVRLHRDANLNLIRNWNGQSTTQDLYDACDQYGILVWQEFFKSSEGPSPANDPRDIANIRDIIVRFRNHPSLLLYCGGNEGSPPQVLVDALDSAVAELDPKRLSLTSSAGDTGPNAVVGFTSGGPYQWVTPATHFGINDGTVWPPFHNEVGSYSIPTLEFTEKMIPPTSWETPDDYWADRDINGNGGNGGGAGYIALTGQRYGTPKNLPDFIRKSQLMNYECIRSIYESRVARMIGVDAGRPYPPTGVIMWMTNPAQPSFVWDMYSHDLEAHSSFYAVQKACRRVNVVVDAKTNDLLVANHTRSVLRGSVHVTAYDLQGRQVANATRPVAAAASNHTVAGNIANQLKASTTNTVFVRVAIADRSGTELSSNFYWLEKPGTSDGFTALNLAPAARISVVATGKRQRDGSMAITAQVKNTGTSMALMVHLQAHDTRTGDRILPATFTDNYLNLVPGEAVETSVQIAADALPKSGSVGVRVDGWSIDQSGSRLKGSGVQVGFNTRAQDVNPVTATFNVAPFTVQVPQFVKAGATFTATTQFLNTLIDTVRAVTVGLKTPSGWTAKATTPATFGKVNPGQQVTTTWQITAPASASPGDQAQLQATASYTDAGQSSTRTADASVTITSGATPDQVTPLITQVSPAAGSLQIRLTNSSPTPSTVSAVEWTLGDQSGTEPVTATIAANASTTVTVKIASPTFGQIYPVTVTSVLSDGTRSAPLSGHVTFVPVVHKSLGSSWTLADVSAGPAVELSDYQGSGSATLPDGFGGKFWLNWDSTNLYITASVTDRNFSQPATGGNIWQGDSLQVAATSGVPGSSATVPAAATQGHYEYGLALTTAGTQLYRWLAPTGQSTGSVTNAAIEVTRDDAAGTTLYRLALPWSDLTSIQPTTNAVFAISMLVNDTDNGTREGYLQWGGGIGATKDVAQFNTAQLLP